MVMASSSFLTLMTLATGPKISSLAMVISGVTPVKTLGLRKQVSGYIWAGSTLVLSLILFPPKLVIPVYVCWAWLDPLCSILKRNPPFYPMVPFALYVSLFLLLTRIPGPGGLTTFGLMGDLSAAFLTATVALLLEYPTIKAFNDDYLMVIGPLLALSIFNEITLSF